MSRFIIRGMCQINADPTADIARKTIGALYQGRGQGSSVFDLTPHRSHDVFGSLERKEESVGSMSHKEVHERDS